MQDAALRMPAGVVSPRCRAGAYRYCCHESVESLLEDVADRVDQAGLEVRAGQADRAEARVVEVDEAAPVAKD